MGALPADVARAGREATIASVEDAAIKSRFPRARDGVKAPASGFFDSKADAQTALAARAALIGVVRRRFVVRAAEAIEPDIAAGIPVWRLIDAEQAVDGNHLTARIVVDFEAETTSVELFG